MIIKCLNKLFSDEVQYSGNRQDCVSPDVITNKENTVIVPDKFKRDIEALETYIGRKLESGLCIKVDLSETDAYNTLVKFLKDEFGIDLIINSKKQRGDTHEK